MQNPRSRSAPLAPKRVWPRLLLWAGLVLGALGLCVAWGFYTWLGRTPGELMRYTERRLIGHNRLEMVAHPVFAVVRPWIEQPITMAMADPGKGQQTVNLPRQTYDAQGRPLEVHTGLGVAPQAAPMATQVVYGLGGMQQAVMKAQPGDVIELADGVHKFKGNVRIEKAGTRDRPIVVRASRPGAATIEFNAGEGFVVKRPYWVFENLVILGKCPRHYDCEHAFHVVGAAKGTVIRNNRIVDYNAHIKVNVQDGQWPDDGLIQYNTLTNTVPREVHLPVTPIDVVAAHRWRVADNHISHFIKNDGNKVSFGVFMKGAGEDGRIERNLIVCTNSGVSQPGMRVGLSFGGGGTGARYCRDKQCVTEHTRGVAAYNTIAHCNDFGIYINRANQTLIEHNELINTYGIDVRFPESSAVIRHNRIEGRIRERDGGLVDAYDNQFD